MPRPIYYQRLLPFDLNGLQAPPLHLCLFLIVESIRRDVVRRLCAGTPAWHEAVDRGWLNGAVIVLPKGAKPCETR